MLGKLKSKFSRGFQFLSDIKSILLSHHPNCEYFSKHVYHVRKYRLCIGCFTFYPSIAITIIFTLLFIDLNYFNLLLIFNLSYIFMLPVILNFLKLTKFRVLKIFSKISLGIGIGLYIVAIFVLPFHILIKIFTILEINIFVGVIAYIRSIHIQKECKKCDYQGDWDSCPGMKPVRDKLYAHGFRTKKT